jgi:hypothetical protein
MNLIPTESAWRTQARNRAFWGEMSPCDHAVQIYGDDEVFFDTLEGFVAGGIEAGEAAIVIATPVHLRALEGRLQNRGISLSIALSRQHYIPLDAEETLDQFMVQGWPDEDLFNELVMDLLKRAKGPGRRVRAFGEMVALMWAKGMNGATVRLEHLWHQFCHREGFALFCAYPRTGFTQDADISIREICDAHSRIVAG